MSHFLLVRLSWGRGSWVTSAFSVNTTASSQAGRVDNRSNEHSGGWVTVTGRRFLQASGRQKRGYFATRSLPSLRLYDSKPSGHLALPVVSVAALLMYRQAQREVMPVGQGHVSAPALHVSQTPLGIKPPQDIGHTPAVGPRAPVIRSPQPT